MFDNEFVKTIHKDVYPAISLSRPELSQAGRVVLITGGSSGIGYATARAFAKASAARIIIISRREGSVQEGVSKLTAELGAALSRTIVEGRVCDVSDTSATESLWSALQKEGITVDVLVLNAATASEVGTYLDRKLDSIWGDFKLNVRSTIDFMQRFYKQTGHIASNQKFLLYVSSPTLHAWMGDHVSDRPGYVLTKAAATLAIQQTAQAIDSKKMQVVVYHPGAVLTNAARSAGWTKDSFPWDNENLPAQFAVWGTSKEADFLHGRLVSAKWDVDELSSEQVRQRIKDDPNYLRIGVVGLTDNHRS